MPEIEKVTLTLRMDATITIHDASGEATDWLKPGSEGSVTWKGGIPSDTETKLGYQWLRQRIANQLQEVIVESKNQIDRERRGG
jgi:hypothetical protein